MHQIEDILHYWFGTVDETGMPSENRSHIWFGGDPEIDKAIREEFESDYHRAINDEFIEWEDSPRGSLALIIVFDQFSRNMCRDLPHAYDQDEKALDLCLRGIDRQFDHSLSLIERAFFYMPLMHSEELEMQATSVRAYKILVDLSFPEAKDTFETMLEYAIRHFEVVQRFGRFPHRNEALGRNSTDEEVEFLKQSGVGW